MNTHKVKRHRNFDTENTQQRNSAETDSRTSKVENHNRRTALKQYLQQYHLVIR